MAEQQQLVRQPRTIWRLRLQHAVVQQVQLPSGSRVLDVQRREGDVDPNALDLWAEVTPTEPKHVMLYAVRLVGTGDRAPEHLTYVSTVQLDGGRLVFHVYVQTIQPGEVRG